MNFVKTSYEDVADYLRINKYTELPKQGKFYVFMNNGKATFSENIKKRTIIDNKACI